MSKLSRKESIALATIHDVLRELRIRGLIAYVSMDSDAIRIKAYPDTEKEAKELKRLLCFFKDEDDEIGITHIPQTECCNEFYRVELKKRMV